jgi:DMSO/TMAO reductase YedYZ heme-binding membrane subunit
MHHYETKAATTRLGCALLILVILASTPSSKRNHTLRKLRRKNAIFCCRLPPVRNVQQ